MDLKELIAWHAARRQEHEAKMRERHINLGAVAMHQGAAAAHGATEDFLRGMLDLTGNSVGGAKPPKFSPTAFQRARSSKNPDAYDALKNGDFDDL